MFVASSEVSSQYEREISKGKNPTTVKLTSWQIRASVLRKLNRAPTELRSKRRSVSGLGSCRGPIFIITGPDR